MRTIVSYLTLFILFFVDSAYSNERNNKLIEFPADISFVIFDLKYNHEDGVKICEIQPGGVSVFSGYDFLMEGDGLVPDMLCDAILKYQSDLWYMDSAVCDRKCKRKFDAMGWENIFSLEDLSSDKEFMRLAELPVNDPHNLYDYHGILYVRPKDIARLEDLRSKYPGMIILDAALYSNIKDKLSMDALLKSSPKLSELRPKSKIYPKEFSNELVADIMEDIKGDYYVIKPAHASKGYGVIITEKENLESTLKLILQKENRGNLARNPDQTYSYWAYDKRKQFLVEQFIQSVHVEAPQFDSKMYDGTMRVVALVIYHQKKVEVDILEGHWKLPKKSVSEEGSFTEKHKSFGNVPHFAAVEPYILESVKRELEEGFDELYMNCNSGKL